MALPITTGILRRNIRRVATIRDGSSTSTYVEYFDNVYGAKQAKPVDRPLPYTRKTGTSQWSGNVFWDTTLDAEVTLSNATNGNLSRFLTLARNKAYEKLKDELLSNAQIGASLAEHDQASKMISSRARQLLDLAKALKKRDFKGAAKALGVPHKSRPKDPTIKTFGNLWLEYHFGWEPLVQDIHEGLQVLTQPVKTLWTRERYSEPYNITLLTNNGHPYKLFGKCGSSMQAGISVDNKNVVLANGLGLLNPAAVAWELVPYSFVLDWYVNIGQVISSMTDFYGLSLVNPYHTDTVRMNWDLFYTQPYPPGYSGNYIVSVKGRGVYMDRGPGLISPAIAVKQYRVPSIIRAATQISLLSQFLEKQAPRR